MDKGPLGIHKVKLVIQPSPSLRDDGGVGQTADGSDHRGQVRVGNHSWRLVVDANLVACWTPVNKVDNLGFLDSRNCGIDILGNHIAPIEKTDGHVLSLGRITLDHLVLRQKARLGDLIDRDRLMHCFLSWHDRIVRGQRVVDPGIGDQVGLELIEVYIQGSIKSKRSRDRRDDLSNDAIEIGIGGPCCVQVISTQVIDGLIVAKEGDIRVLHDGVGRQKRVVGLHNRCRNLRRRVDDELQLCFLGEQVRESLHQKGSEARSSSSPEGMEHQEPLEAIARLRHLGDPFLCHRNYLLANCVMSSGKVVGSIFFAVDQGGWPEEVPVISCSHLV